MQLARSGVGEEWTGTRVSPLPVPPLDYLALFYFLRFVPRRLSSPSGAEGRVYVYLFCILWSHLYFVEFDEPRGELGWAERVALESLQGQSNTIEKFTLHCIYVLLQSTELSQQPKIPGLLNSHYTSVGFLNSAYLDVICITY